MYMYDPEPGLARGDATLSVTCARLGVDVRGLNRWRADPLVRADFDVADVVLTRGEMCWWDVFNEHTVRTPALVVRRYEWLEKASRGKMYAYRGRVGSRMYGDLGPDLESLATIEQSFTGEQAVAA